MKRVTVSGYLRARRYVPFTRGCGLLGLAMAAMCPNPAQVDGWWIDDYGFIFFLSDTRRLPKALTPEDEGEWVTVSGVAEPWPNGYGANLKRIRREAKS